MGLNVSATKVALQDGPKMNSGFNIQVSRKQLDLAIKNMSNREHERVLARTRAAMDAFDAKRHEEASKAAWVLADREADLQNQEKHYALWEREYDRLADALEPNMEKRWDRVYDENLDESARLSIARRSASRSPRLRGGVK
jgi:hypothetical protein